MGIAATAALLAVPAGASALTYPVTNTADSGGGSLRDAMTTANGTTADDVIDITATGTISPTSAALPAIPAVATGGKLTIQGPGASALTVSRNFAATGSVFSVQANANASISGMTITNGTASGVFNSGTLSLDAVEISGNSTASGGGGIHNGSSPAVPATLTVDRSAIVGNTTTGAAGAGGIYDNQSSTVTVLRSTISQNTVSTISAGGGAAVFGSATFTASTIAGNTSAAGSAPFATGTGANLFVQSTTATLNQTLVADALSSTATAPTNCQTFGGTISSLGYNLADDSSCSLSAGTDLPVADPALGPLTGPAPRYKPFAASSPAADKIPAASCATSADQRNVARPQGALCDVGAFEFQAAASPTPTTPSPAPKKKCKKPKKKGKSAAAAKKCKKKRKK